MTIEEAKKKLVEVARSQVGYHEGANNYNKYAEDPRITQLYGWDVQNQPWCCTFVNWCFLQAFGDIGGKVTYGGSAACANQAQLYRKNRAFNDRPELGDQIFFISGGGINHTGIVVEVNGSTIRTVEGNYSDKVSECTYILGNPKIAGFGRPKWELVQEDREKPYVVVQNGQIVNSSNWQQEETQPETEGKPVTAQPKENHDWSPPLLKYAPDDYYEAAKAMQSLLNVHRFDSGRADGYFGPKTVAAVNRAKRFYGLEVDGTCDRPLWEKLMAI